MVYLLVMIVSAIGILSILSARGILRSRNARRIVHAVKKGFSSVDERNAKLIPDTKVERPRKSPRTCAVELQQVRTLLRESEKLVAKQDPKAAEQALIQALTIQPDAKEVKIQLAKIYLETGREPKAEALYRELVQDSEDPALFANLGLACYKQEAYVEACQAYQQALNLDAENPQRSADLGKACIAANRMQEAALLLEKASESLTKDIDLLHLLAQCYTQLNDMDNAEDAYRRINRLDPRDQEVKARLAQLARV